MNEPVSQVFTIQPGKGRVCAAVSFLDDDAVVIMYSPQFVNKKDGTFSELYKNNQPVTLQRTTSPLVLSLPGSYYFLPDGDISENASVEVSPTDGMTVVHVASVDGGEAIVNG